MELYDGHYLLQSNLIASEPKETWKMYMLLVEIEAVALLTPSPGA